MDHTITFIDKLARFTRWLGRIVAASMALFVLVIAAGEGLVPADLTLEETVMMLGFLTAWFGFLIGWKWERLGGGLIIAGLAWHCLFEYLFRGSMFLGFWIVLPALPGILFLLCRWLSRREQAVRTSVLTSAPLPSGHVSR
jgi:hypothetical protein